MQEFADKLSRHLATVLASERGFVEVACPDCRATEGRGRSRAATLREVAERGTPPPANLDEPVALAVSSVCTTCGGGRRVWSKTSSGRVHRMSDRQVIETFAAEPHPTGRAQRG